MRLRWSGEIGLRAMHPQERTPGRPQPTLSSRRKRIALLLALPTLAPGTLGSWHAAQWPRLPAIVERLLRSVTGLRSRITSGVVIWDAPTGRPLAGVTGLPQMIDRAAFSPDGKVLATADGSTIRLWDIPSPN